MKGKPRAGFAFVFLFIFILVLAEPTSSSISTPISVSALIPISNSVPWLTLSSSSASVSTANSHLMLSELTGGEVLWSGVVSGGVLGGRGAVASVNVVNEVEGWLRGPADAVEFDYVMTARVRLLFFWAGKDDVGGGYIRRGTAKGDSRQEFLQVLFGSDPAKAPRSINRWGAGTEFVLHKGAGAGLGKVDDIVASTFFGFMKSSKGKSVSEMQAELKRERDGGEHEFTGILSRVEAGRASSVVAPLASNVDYNLHQYGEAEPLMLAKLSSAGQRERVLENPAGCSRAGEFLGTVSELLNAALSGRGGEPLSLCYIYDAQVNKLSIEHTEAVRQLAVKVNAAKGGVLTERTYENLLQADFVSVHQATGKRVSFTVVVGTAGELRGVPVQIRYQPNWWFQVVLNLLPASTQHRVH